ncbi:MAG TPA: replication-associated recombination protein A [Pseudomonadales bacterium]|nr:replication-associated recombination protein A [Pseudomonadales bacterium]
MNEAADAPYVPLAARMRPRHPADFFGQEHLLGPDKPISKAIDSGHVHSMILWGPPGVGKTSLARLLAETTGAHFQTLSAVLAGVKEIRAAIDAARVERSTAGRRSILFVDEVHRFNKTQQDAFLPFVEDGTVIFIGATTENPSFELNGALLSRTRVYRLRAMDEESISRMLAHALSTDGQLLARAPRIDAASLARIARAADGDARRALNLLEIAVDLAVDNVIGDVVLREVLGGDPRRFDKGGDIFYDQISALHKAVRGGSPDAALYWLARMLDGGCDPLYIARRVVRMATEDIGNADPRGLSIALAAWDTQERLGSPEGELAIAQALAYLACAPRSNAVYTAFAAARADVRELPGYEVPLHLRNAPTRLMKEMGFGAEYRYAHDEPDAYAAGENYFPPELAERRYYHPVARGLEKQIGDKLAWQRERDAASSHQRYSRTVRGSGRGQ